MTLVQGQYLSCVLKSQIVPGLEQSSSRGEIPAGILGLAVAHSVTLHTDYQLFHDRVCDFKRGCQVQSRWTNIDLWEIVYKMVCDRCNQVGIIKVKAHENWETLSGDRRMQAWHNHQVDLAAKNQITSFPLFSKYQKIVKILNEQTNLQKGYAGFLADCAMDVFKNKIAKMH